MILIPHRWLRAALIVALPLVAACGASRADVIPPDTAQPDRFLMDRGNEALENRRWPDAREYFRQIIDNYPASPVRPDAKLGIGDAYRGEGSTESLLMAALEYREFMTFYPTNPRADYAQYQLAMTHYQQMRSPQRDQSETKEALREFQQFFDRFPQSALMPEVREKWREARDRLSEHSVGVGVHYLRMRAYGGAISRFREVLRDDPEYSRRDAVYFHLAEALARTDNHAEAIPYYQRLLDEYDQSEHRSTATRRLQELRVQ